mmetsp:Transcript_13527/g.32296  ORF Transcript_13527/g.32296 Transcript_13527/m.32296 type:complete len:246 (-) Transcript_13527:687-1424(-)
MATHRTRPFDRNDRTVPPSLKSITDTESAEPETRRRDWFTPPGAKATLPWPVGWSLSFRSGPNDSALSDVCIEYTSVHKLVRTARRVPSCDAHTDEMGALVLNFPFQVISVGSVAAQTTLARETVLSEEATAIIRNSEQHETATAGICMTTENNLRIDFSTSYTTTGVVDLPATTRMLPDFVTAIASRLAFPSPNLQLSTGERLTTSARPSRLEEDRVEDIDTSHSSSMDCLIVPETRRWPPQQN